MKKLTKRILYGIGFLSLVGLALASFIPEPVPVEMAEVDRGPVRILVEGSGTTRLRDHYTLSAPVSGELNRITLRAGDEVKAKDVIAVIVPAQPGLLDERSRAEVAARVAAAQAAHAEARARVEQAKINLEQATREAQRARRLVQSGALPRQALDDAETAEQASQATLTLAQRSVVRASREVTALRATLGLSSSSATDGDQELVELTAPINGVVLRVHKQSAGPVQAGTPLVEIGDPSTIEAAIELVTQLAVRVEPGASASIVGYGLDTPLTGIVRSIEPAAFTKVTALGVEEQRVLVVIDPAGDKARWHLLGDGYHVEARIVLDESESALRVPGAAVFHENGDPAVFSVINGRAVITPIDVALVGAEYSEVVDGLPLKSKVIVYPSDRVTGGVRVVEER